MDFNYTFNIGEVLKSLQKRGAFLTVKDKNGKCNTMTIGWGNIGYEWGKPVFKVLVRESRYTYEFLENAEDFTVSIPMDDNMKDAIGFCGRKSGRDYDKFKECNLKLQAGKNVQSPVIKNCGMIYECKLIYKHLMDLKFLNEDIKKQWYKDNDIHTMYYGEIVNCYNNK